MAGCVRWPADVIRLDGLRLAPHYITCRPFPPRPGPAPVRIIAPSSRHQQLRASLELRHRAIAVAHHQQRRAPRHEEAVLEHARRPRQLVARDGGVGDGAGREDVDDQVA